MARPPLIPDWVWKERMMKTLRESLPHESEERLSDFADELLMMAKKAADKMRRERENRTS